MRSHCLVCLLLASLAYGQAAQPALSPATDNVPETKVGPDDSVIKIDGFCPDRCRQGTPCQTIVTRAQFEKLTKALQPGMSLSLRLKVANAYARNLRMAAAAEKRGLDKTAAFEEEMRYARMQLLAQDLDRALQADASNITGAEVEDYYKKNESSFEQATVARIFIPHARNIASADNQSTATSRADQDADAKAAEDAMMKVAVDLRARAVTGEDPDKLQLEAYAEAGSPRITVNTKMEKVRRATLPPQHETVLDLKPGQISAVFSDPGGAHFIYKMISKQTLTLEEAKTEISNAISRQRYRDSTKGFQGDVVFNDAYFVPSGKPATPPQRKRRGKSRKPPTAPDEDHD
jgi:hypothetical protein